MSHVCVLESQTHWTDETFVFWWFTGEVLTDEGDFVDSSLPTFSLSLTWSDDLEHFGFSHGLDLFNRYWPFACLFFTFLLDHVGEDFTIFLLFSIHQISRHGAFFYILNSRLWVFLFMLLDSFFHLNFLFKSFFVKDLGFKSSKGLCFFRYDLCLSCFFLTTFLISI